MNPKPMIATLTDSTMVNREILYSTGSGTRMIREHDCIVLTRDIPDEGLQSGDVGTAVHVHGDGTAYEVEFMTLTGDTVAVATVLPSQLRPVSRKDIAHVRELATH